MKLLLKPNDVLFFRGNQNYTAGEEHVVNSILPSPQTIAGAIRSKIYFTESDNEDIKKLIGYKKEEPEFQILGSFFCKKTKTSIQEYFTMPNDITTTYIPNLQKEIKRTISFVKYNKVKWNEELTIPLLSCENIQFQSLGGYLNLVLFKKYLIGNLSREEINNHSNGNVIYYHESRIGIKRCAKTKTSEEGYLYKTAYLRLKSDSRICVWLGKDSQKVIAQLGKDGLLALGGENRIASYKVLESTVDESFDELNDKIVRKCNDEQQLKLYVATSLILKDSTNSKYEWNPSSYLKKNYNIEVEEIHPLLSKCYNLSGWDYANQRPKEMKYLVPEGSVYYVKFKGNISNILMKLGEQTKLGYGLCFVGVWNSKEE